MCKTTRSWAKSEFRCSRSLRQCVHKHIVWKFQEATSILRVKLWRWFCRPGVKPGSSLSGSTLAAQQIFFSNLQLWQFITLQPFDIHRPTLPLWKDLNLLNIHSINSKDYKDFKDSFCLVKVASFLQCLYVIGVYIFFAMAVHSIPL